MIKKLKRVAAYCRVSVESELMESSITNQIVHFTNKINNNPLWQNAGVFADYGISGTTTKKRPQFNRMIALALQGKIDLILAKSIQRFARNTVDLLATVRQLKEHNVEVFFEKENLSTFSHDGELMLSIMASFAQEESRNISDNIRWAIKKRFEQGIPNGRNPVFGYDWKGDDLIVNETEGWIVTKMFQDYANGMRVRDIVAWVNQTGAKTRKGKAWAAFRLAKDVYDSPVQTREEYQASIAYDIGVENMKFAPYFDGISYTSPAAPGVNHITFEPGCRNHWHIHHASSGGGQLLICTGGKGWYQQ